MGCLTLPALRPRASTRPINARVVRRSLALRGLAQQVSYSECSSVGLWLRLGWVYASRGLGYFRGEPINLSPRSGEGPPSWLLEEGAFAVEVTATAASGAQAVATVAGKGDPGYGATAKMLAEVGLCLSLDAHERDAALADAAAKGDLTRTFDAICYMYG